MLEQLRWRIKDWERHSDVLNLIAVWIYGWALGLSIGGIVFLVFRALGDK